MEGETWSQRSVEKGNEQPDKQTVPYEWSVCVVEEEVGRKLE